MKKFDTKPVAYPCVWPVPTSYSVIKYSGSTLKQGAALCLKHQLFVKGWLMRKIYAKILDDKRALKCETLYILSRNGHPVAALFSRTNTKMAIIYVSLFVSIYERRKGHGKTLINTVIKDNPNLQVMCSIGSRYSRKFFETALGDVPYKVTMLSTLVDLYDPIKPSLGIVGNRPVDVEQPSVSSL